jgi:glutathione S-transferase
MADLPILYSFRRCPYAMRARLALAVSETSCVLREVQLSNKPAQLIAASPKATVPVIVLPMGRVLEESIDIMRWALRRSDPQGWLEADQAATQALIEANDGAFKQHLDRYKYPDRYGVDPIEHRSLGLAILSGLDERLAAQANLCGDGMSLADAACCPSSGNLRKWTERGLTTSLCRT